MRKFLLLVAAMLAVPTSLPALAQDTPAAPIGPASVGPAPIGPASVVKAGVDAWSLGDFAGAFKAWQGPAQSGDADAQFNLAQAYKLGRGVPADMKVAEDWYRRAALQGHLQAGDNYGLILFQSGRRDQAMEWIVRSAGRGEPRAQYILGIATFNGDMVAKDWVRAYALMTRAAASGLPQARDSLASMDGIIPLGERQMGISLAGDLERNAEETRAREVAANDLGTVPTFIPAATAPLRPNPPPTPVAAAEIPPSAVAGGQVLAGADFAGPVALGKTPAPAPTAKHIPFTPAPAAVAAPKKPVTPPRPVTAPSGRYRIQFGAFGKKSNADALWMRLRGRAELAGRSRFDVSAGAITRLQAGSFASESEASRACAALASVSGQCVVVRP